MMTAQNVSKLVSPLGVRARVVVLATRGGYMCRVPSSTVPVPQPRDPFKCPTARRRPPGIAGIIILSRRPARARVARSVCIPSIESIVRSFQ